MTNPKAQKDAQSSSFNVSKVLKISNLKSPTANSNMPHVVMHMGYEVEFRSHEAPEIVRGNPTLNVVVSKMLTSLYIFFPSFNESIPI